MHLSDSIVLFMIVQTLALLTFIVRREVAFALLQKRISDAEAAHIDLLREFKSQQAMQIEFNGESRTHHKTTDQALHDIQQDIRDLRPH